MIGFELSIAFKGKRGPPSRGLRWDISRLRRGRRSYLFHSLCTLDECDYATVVDSRSDSAISRSVRMRNRARGALVRTLAELIPIYSGRKVNGGAI